jgi:hypothetical protein
MAKEQPAPQRWPRRGRPVGQPTRGKTAQNRLRRVDLFLSWYAADLLRRRDGAFANAWLVDLGYGAEPFTTLEMAQRLRRLNSQLPVLGVEIDAERVAAALPYADDLTHFRRGGFNLPLAPRADGSPEAVRAIRAFNVLRQYDEANVASAYREMAHSVLPGGLLVEGTSDPLGRLWVANVMQRAADAARWEPRLLVFSTNFRGGCEPGMFQTVLPKSYIHHMTPGEPIWNFMQAWKQAGLRCSAAQAWGLRAWFVASAHMLAAEAWPVRVQGRWLRHGFLLVAIGEKWQTGGQK